MIKYVQAIDPRRARGLVRPVYAQIKRDFGKIVEPFLLHSPIPELLAGAWMACRETELVGSVPRYFPKDTQLIGALAWASFTAARKICVQL